MVVSGEKRPLQRRDEVGPDFFCGFVNCFTYLRVIPGHAAGYRMA
jgi:hypothetical protein